MTDVHALLRSETRARHDALEHANWLDEALRDLRAYARHVVAVGAFHAAAERALDAHRAALRAHGFDPDARAKTPLLARELDALRAHGIAAAAGAPPRFPALSGLSAAVGALYVIEGATLGGVVIAGRVRARLGWESAFYGAYARETGPRWRAFVAAAQAASARLDPAALVEGANATFEAYGDAVARRCPAP